MYKISDPEPSLDPTKQVPSFILSDVSNERLTQEQVAKYCQDRGGSLPTIEQFTVLSKAMTDGRRYNVNAIPLMNAHTFWSSSIVPGTSNFFFFNGGYGYIDESKDNHEYRYVRCVIAAEKW